MASGLESGRHDRISSPVLRLLHIGTSPPLTGIILLKNKNGFCSSQQDRLFQAVLSQQMSFKSRKRL